MLRDLHFKLAAHQKEMRRLCSRRDAAGVQGYNEARWWYLKLIKKQEIFWKQRAKQYWLRDGDKNTRFFHKFASTRKENNKIQGLIDETGQWADTNAGIQQVIDRYFEDMFSTRAMGECLSDIIQFAEISEKQKHDLIQPIIKEEVKDAVYDMHPEKSPGMDMLNLSFFQSYWDIVRTDVVIFCQKFFTAGELPKGVNHTLFCLIPKVKNPK